MKVKFVLRASHEKIANESKHGRVEHQAIVCGASGLRNLEKGSELGDDSANNSTNELVNKAVREGRADHVEKESGSKGSLSLARKSEHFVCSTKKKKYAESE